MTKTTIHSYLTITDDNTVGIGQEFEIDTADGVAYHSTETDLQELVDEFISDLNHVDTTTAVNELYVLANEFDRFAAELRDLADTRDSRDFDTMGIGEQLEFDL